MHKALCVCVRLSSAKLSAPVIMDRRKLSYDEEDEDEQFLVVEAVALPSDVLEVKVGSDFSSVLWNTVEKPAVSQSCNHSCIVLQDPAQELDSEEQHGTKVIHLFRGVFMFLCLQIFFSTWFFGEIDIWLLFCFCPCRWPCEKDPWDQEGLWIVTILPQI